MGTSPGVWAVGREWQAGPTWLAVLQGLTTIALAGTPLRWKSSSDAVISCFTNGIFLCGDLFTAHPLILCLNCPREKLLRPPNVFSALLSLLDERN